MPEPRRKALAYWLQNARRKLQTAHSEQAPLKMGYLASTQSWKILEGLWAANHLPMPPAGAVFAHISRLEAPLPPFELFTRRFGSDPPTRSKTALTLIDW
ncbi:hypothetical protein [uncultured Meiothermus sp.]|uniref:hypothetical protein n=1 Tax=uncultured Meiothermus sp. TaxID=157471 RepID=UPI0026255D4A|nr:hypothetical protein [uncultured Meiothermus sp.]